MAEEQKVKPKVRVSSGQAYTSPTVPKQTRLGAMGVGTARNADGIGMAGAVLVTWAITTFGNVELPPEVTVAIGTLVGAIAARIKG